MMRVVARRIALSIPLLLFVSFTVFVLISFMPGDPAVTLAGSNPELVPFIRHSLNLDQPLLLRYWDWLSQAVQGNLGLTWRGLAVSDHESVLGLILARAPITASIALLAVLFSVVGGLAFGMVAATRSGSLVDKAIQGFAAVLIAVPGFWLGYLLLYWFGIKLGWLPVFSYVPISNGVWPWLSHIILPAAALSNTTLAALILQFRGAMLETLSKEYVLNARAKGLSQRRILWNHAFRNALTAVITILGFQLAGILGATAIVENVFGIPGLGTLAVDAAFSRDVPTLLGLLMCTTLVVVVVNTLMDLLYAYLNPKVR